MASQKQTITLWIIICTCALAALPIVTGTLTAVYMPTSCGVPTTVSPSLQLESATGLTYTNNMNCNITFTVASPYLLLANMKRFELEPQRSGTCNDYVNLHDGADVSSSRLNAEALCGNSLTNSSYVTSAQQLTVHFVTDATAVYHGFSIILTAVTVAPCGTGQFQCNNSYCIDSTLVCDGYDQCPEISDEQNCSATSTSSGTNWIPLIVGLILGLLEFLLLLALILYRLHRRNRWRRFTNQYVDRDDLPDPDPAYPVTYKYFRGIRGHPDLRPGSYAATEAAKGSLVGGEKTGV